MNVIEVFSLYIIFLFIGILIIYMFFFPCQSQKCTISKESNITKNSTFQTKSTDLNLK